MKPKNPNITFMMTFKNALEQDVFVKLSLGHYTGREEALQKIHVRRILVKRKDKLSFTYHYKTRDIVKNFDIEEGLDKIQSTLDGEFKTATLFTTAYNLILENNALKEKPPTQVESPSANHDYSKKRWIPSAGSHYLSDLNITDKHGRVFDRAQDKFRQIDKYIEIIDSLTKNMPSQNLGKIIDMGAGKGYLTFALYDYFRNIRNIDIKILGVEYRADLVELCNKIARDSSFKSLSFEQGAIADFKADDVNVLIALHACDTATDDAIAKGIKAGSELIIVAPCCHKQIRDQMEAQSMNSPLDLLTRHGIFMERQAEMVTDTLRGLLLEYHGYDVKIFEFISDAHTAKNIMIVGQKKKGGQTSRERMAAQIFAFKAQFGVRTHYLEQLLDFKAR